MSTLKTVAAFDNQDNIERTIDTLVEAGIDPSDIKVVTPQPTVEAVQHVQEFVATPVVPDDASVLLAVTAPQEDTVLVEDILREGGEIDLAASDTPALGWAGDPEGENLDTSRTPKIGWSGKVGRPG